MTEPTRDEKIAAVRQALHMAEHYRDTWPAGSTLHLGAAATATALRAILRDLEAGGWQLIDEEPPPEDTEVEAGLRDATGVYIMNDYFSSEHQCWVDWHQHAHRRPPTHWRVMVAPPVTGDAEPEASARLGKRPA